MLLNKNGAYMTIRSMILEFTFRKTNSHAQVCLLGSITVYWIPYSVPYYIKCYWVIVKNRARLDLDFKILQSKKINHKL